MNNTERCPRGHEREIHLEFSRLCDTCGLAWLESEWASSNPEQRYANRLEAAYQDIKRWRKRAELAEAKLQRLKGFDDEHF